MPAIDKNQAVIDFLLDCPVIAYNPLFFNFLQAQDNNKQIIVLTSDTSLNKKFIDGSVMKRYLFTIIDFRSVAYQPLPKVEGYSSENVEEFLDVQGIIDWINEQADAGNYPDFGSDYIIDSMQPTSNNPSLNGVDTQVTPALAKYSITIQIDYLDKTKSWNN